MAATNAQVQQYVNDRLRPFAERYRALKLEAEDIRATIDDVYQNVNNAGSTWADANTSNPPHMLSRADVLALNTAAENLKAFMQAEAQLAVILNACVRPVVG